MSVVSNSKYVHLPDSYRLSFGTGGLYVMESFQLIELFGVFRDWPEVIEAAVKKNLLQFKSISSSRRAVREKFFPTADPFDQSLLSWLACCRTYQFIGDFATQVLMENFASYKLDLDHAAFDFFYEEQSQFHPELEQLTEGTRKKLRQVLFRMMREAGILSDDHRIIAGITSPSHNDINTNGKRDFSLFIPGAN
jgi:hypothetical protein